MTTYCPVPGPVPAAPSNKGYAGGFATAMMLKDLKLAQEAAMSSGAVTPMGSEAMAQYSLFDRLGYGGKDFSAIIQMLRGKLDELK
jgi:3-hydroxyisobutyrate dehydrogenase